MQIKLRLAGAAALSALAFGALADVTIGVDLSTTGPAASIGM